MRKYVDIDDLIKPPRLRFPGKSEEEQGQLLRPRGDAHRDRLVAARLELRSESAQ
jgi:hypothetical protein